MSGHLYTRGDFARAFLPRVGAPVTTNNMRAMLAWMQAEGDAGRFNPLNTTLRAPGSTDFNFVHVQNYQTFESGVKASADTLNFGARRGEHGYRAIRHALHTNAPPRETLEAVEASDWGTGGLALDVLATVPVMRPRYRHHRLVQ